MIEFTKSEKRELRRLAGEAYKAEMEKEVAQLEVAFKTWRDGKITVFDLQFYLTRSDIPLPCSLGLRS